MKEDLTGKTFGMVTVLEFIGIRDAHKRRYWLCLCQNCGKRFEHSTTHIKSHKSCGCLTTKKEITGQRFGRLIAIRAIPTVSKSGMKGYSWECKCDCGKTTIIAIQRLCGGVTKSCGCLVKDTISLPTNIAAYNRLYASYKRNAKKRNIEFDVPLKIFSILINQPCTYCGALPSNIMKATNGSIKYTGLDRLDAKLGYAGDNIIPCCGRCNIAKRSMSVGEFIIWLLKTSKNIAERINMFVEKSYFTQSEMIELQQLHAVDNLVPQKEQ